MLSKYTKQRRILRKFFLAMDQIRGRNRSVITLLLFILAILAVLLVLYETRYGPGVGGDSVRYIMGS